MGDNMKKKKGVCKFYTLEGHTIGMYTLLGDYESDITYYPLTKVGYISLNELNIIREIFEDAGKKIKAILYSHDSSGIIRDAAKMILYLKRMNVEWVGHKSEKYLSGLSKEKMKTKKIGKWPSNLRPYF